jgi:hypothetical protein
MPDISQVSENPMCFISDENIVWLDVVVAEATAMHAVESAQ